MESWEQKLSGSFVKTKRPCMDQPSDQSPEAQTVLCSHASKSDCGHLGNKMTENGLAFVIVDIMENNRMPEAQTVLVQSREQKRLWSFRKQNDRKDQPLQSCIPKND